MKLEKELIIKLNNNFNLDKESYQVLTMLYKPMISATSLNIYLSIYKLASVKEEITLLFLRDIISSNLTEEKLNMKLDILKEYKLIKCDNRVIELYPPLSAHEFNKLGLLNYLKNYCSKDQYNYLVSSTYNTDVTIKKIEDFKLSKIKYKQIKKPSLPFDFNEFINHIDEGKEHLIPLKDKIEAIANLYNYSLNDMLRLIYEIELDSNNDLDKLISISYSKYDKKQKKAIKESLNQEIEFINYFKNKKAEEIMLLVKDTKKSRKADEETVRKLRDDLKLSDDIISLLVCYSIVTNESKLHPFVFYKTIIKDWKENNIESVEDAFNYINKLFKENKKKNKLTDIKEDWYDDLIKEYREEQQC